MLNKIKEKYYELMYDLKEALKNYGIPVLFVVVSIILYTILKMFCSKTRVYMHVESKKFFRLNRVNGLIAFIRAIFNDSGDRILVTVTNIEDDKETVDDVELSEFINDYTEFKIASENDRLLYGIR